MAVARWSRMFKGRPESVGEARRYARVMLGGNVHTDAVELAISELATNAVEHTHSGTPDGLFVVELEAFDDHVWVAVVDMGSVGQPVLSGADPASSAAMDGRGLHIVKAVSKDWGTERVRVGRRVWADIAVSD